MSKSNADRDDMVPPSGIKYLDDSLFEGCFIK